MISVSIVGADVVAARFLYLSPKMEAAMERNLTRLAIRLAGFIKSKKLSGQVLNARTGLLRKSITFQVKKLDGGVEAAVGTNIKYAAVHEYGLNVTIPAHLRTVKKVFGRSVKGGEVTQSVKAYTVQYPERSFLRSALADNAEQFRSELRAAVNTTIGGGTV